MTTITQPKQPGGLHSYMVKWNELVQQATEAKLSIPGVKRHTSEFESYAKAQKRVAWLAEQIKALTAAPVQVAGKVAKLPETTAPLGDLPVKALKAAKASRRKGVQQADDLVVTVSGAPAMEPEPETVPAPQSKRQRKPRSKAKAKKAR